MAKKNQTGKDNKKVVNPKGKEVKTPVNKIPIVYDNNDNNVHPHYRNMDE